MQIFMTMLSICVLEEIGAFVFCLVSCFFDYGKNFFDIPELLEHCHAALPDHVEFSFFSNCPHFNQPLFNQEVNVFLQLPEVNVRFVHNVSQLQRSPVSQDLQNIHIRFQFRSSHILSFF